MTVPLTPILRRPIQQSCLVVKEPHASTEFNLRDAAAQRISEAISRGDEAAFRELYDSYQHRLLRLALLLSRGDETLAHDAVQNAFVTAATKLRTVQSEAHLWNWLARVARQHLSKACRDRQRNPTICLEGELPESATGAESNSILEAHLDAGLLAMDPDERQVLEWFYFDHLSYKEIANRLNTTAKAVSSRLERARARLRSWLKHTMTHEQ